jgi:FkbH-like protein
MKKYFVFRNSTVELFFSNLNASFSGYEDISFVDNEAEICIWFYLVPFKRDTQLLVREISSYYNNLELVCQQIPSNKTLYIFTLESLSTNRILIGDFSLPRAIEEFNLKIYDLADKNKNIKILDLADFIKKYPSDQLIDWKYYFISKMQINPKLAPEFQKWLLLQTEAINLNRKKCIVLDLDNTLWGGILGEDGIDGIKIGGDYPGNVFLEFQKSLLELSKSGVILAVCSKNNEADVLELWEKNPYVLIKKEKLSSYRINWDNKADNLKEIARELNIGLDSMVFIDDNPAERELVRKLCPTVTTPDFPSHPYHLPLLEKELIDRYFKIYDVTSEDKDKTAQYKANAERAEFQKGFSDFSEYIKQLEIEISIMQAGSFTIPRIAQMTQKTNQFNLTTKRYSEADIWNFIRDGHLVNCVNVKDKFGDNGITGAIIIKINKESSSAIIDSFLLSCRILGKGIEDAFVLSVLNMLRGEDICEVKATYIPTLKNHQVSNYFERIGFTNDHISADGVKHYSIKINEEEFKIKPYYKITGNGYERQN